VVPGASIPASGDTASVTTRVGRIAVMTLGLAAFVGGGVSVRAQDKIDVVASRGGFRPRAINLRKGETVRVALTTSDDEHCFAVDALRIEKRIVPGKTTTVDLTPERAGTFPFYCCLEAGADAQRGRLVVTE